MSDHAAPAKPKHTPERTCAGTGVTGAPSDFLRFVQGPKNEQGQSAPWPDFSGKLPGRGVYLLPTEAAYQAALKKKAFARHLETNQPPPPWLELADKLQTEALQRLALAKKAGQLVLGTDNILENGRKNMLKGLLLVADAGQDVRNRLTELARRHGVPLVIHFSKTQLEHVLGQANAVAVGLTRLDTAWTSVHKAQQAAPAGVGAASADPRPSDI